jgi:2-oxoglutarate ferredoxin oxidoreductase subunit delta
MPVAPIADPRPAGGPRSAGTAVHPAPDPATAEFIPLRIASERCKGCGLCVTACPPGVLALDTDRVNQLGYHPVRLVDPAGCTSCVRCARVCPDAVFTVFARPREA